VDCPRRRCRFWLNHNHVLGLWRNAEYGMVWINWILLMGQSKSGVDETKSRGRIALVDRRNEHSKMLMILFVRSFPSINV
jgi:hypothetical protein